MLAEYTMWVESRSYSPVSLMDLGFGNSLELSHLYRSSATKGKGSEGFEQYPKQIFSNI